jgi:hypothetical protein
MNLTVIRRFLLGACELINIFIREARNCNNYAKNMTPHQTKFSRHGDQTPGFFAHLS